MNSSNFISSPATRTFACAIEPPDGRPVAYRCLRRSATGGWKIFAVAKALRLYQGRLVLHKVVDQTIEIAFARVELENGEPVRLDMLERESWKIGLDGKIDEAHVRQHIQKELHAPRTAGQPEDETKVFSSEDVVAIRHVLGLL
jgi:hypothetical protein